MPEKRARGRPVEKPIPVPVPIRDMPENVASALVTTPPKDEGDWDYLKADDRESVAASLGKPPKSK